MPTKPLTLHKQTNGEDWFSRGTEYGKREIDGIADGVGGNTKQPPTSIPSPFARFDLVRTALLRLSQDPNLKGEPNDERLVSECFDVGQLFFHFDKFRDQLEIIRWNKEDDLKTLLNARSLGHKRFGKALNLFLDQDGGTAKEVNGYNFHKLKNLFILRYNGNGRSVMLGGTSSSTLFFSSPEDLSFINDLKFGNYKLFTRQYCPLHERNDPDFEKFWYGLLRQPDFATYFPEVASYLRKSLSLLQAGDNKTWQEIGIDAEKLTPEVYAKLFDDLISPAGHRVEVLDDFRIKKAKANESLLTNSEFILHSTKFERKYPETRKPMILQHNYQGQLRYTRDLWDPTVKVEPYDEKDWRNNKRKLPGQADVYPYLTVSDFLEPYIIRLVYPINGAAFYNDGFSGNDITKSYLLPLTETFFDFFEVEDLFAGPGSKVSIDFQRLGSPNDGSVKVTLSIPIKDNELPIKFERTYYSRTPANADERKNEGAVVEYQFGISLMPFIRIESPTFKPLYHVQVADRDISGLTFGNSYQLRFWDRKNNLITSVDAPRERRHKQQNAPDTVTTKYYRVPQNFDYLTVEVAGKRGVVVPRFDQVQKPMGTDKYTFAVDFGTTNTHIEYKTERNPTPHPFTLSPAENLVVTLFDPAFVTKDGSLNGTGATELTKMAQFELIPDRVSKQDQASFPTRTALLENQPNWRQNVYAFSDFNPALLYEKKNLSDYDISTNLKWANYTQNEGDEKRIEGYIESLILLIRNKILLNGGNLDATELVWFYPLSMLETRRVFFEQIWNSFYRQLITDHNYPQRIPESTAPYYWYGQGSGKYEISSASHPAVSIDIGGGTSDVVVFEDEKPTLITSFRFAANAVFGDAFAKEGAADRNGFVRKYKDDIRTRLHDNHLTDLVRAFDRIRDRQRSEDIIAFFFSLKDNHEVQNAVSIDFNEMLAKDDKFKIVFLVFYTALVYHVAKLMRAKTMGMPRYMAFSGNGSKVLQILSTKPAVLSQLAQLIFEEVYEIEKYPGKLDIIVEQDAPKEATCKGGLKRSKELQFDQEDDGREDEAIEKIKAVLLGTTDDRFGTRKDTYEKTDDATLSSVADEVRKYIDILFRLDEKISLRDKLGIKTGQLNDYKNILLDDLNQNVKIGFTNKRAESDVTDPIEETMFFYPLIKGLNTLASELAN